MARLQPIWLAPLLVSALLLAPAPAAAQFLPVTPGMPATLFQPFRIDPTTGKLAPLENVRSRELRKGRGVAFIVDGPESSFVVDREQPLEFAVLLPGPPSVEEVEKQAFFRIEPLAVREQSRYATSRSVPYIAKAYGEARYGVDPRNPKQGARAFRVRPRVTLPLGEYAISTRGLFGDEAAGFVPQEGWAFRVVER
jgi:hypothetical protein